jgi:hypothetical protein
MGKFTELNISIPLNIIYTKGALMRKSKDIDQRMDLAEDEVILEVYAYGTLPIALTKDLIFVLTNKNVYSLIGKDFSKHEIKDVGFQPAPLNQTTVVIQGKIYAAALAYKGNEDGSGVETIDDIVSKKFPDLQHPAKITGFRQSTHLEYLKAQLDRDEKVIYLFTGQAVNWNADTCACALTSSGVIIIASKPFIGEKIKRIYLKDVKEVSVISTLIVSNVVFETITENFAINVVNSKNSSEISKFFRSYLNDYMISQRRSSGTSDTKPVSVADELIKFKQLLDAGVITQTEFDEKKSELLKK